MNNIKAVKEESQHINLLLPYLKSFLLIWQIKIVFVLLSLIGLYFTFLLRRNNKKSKQTEQQNLNEKNTQYMSDTVEDFSISSTLIKQRQSFFLQDLIVKSLELINQHTENMEIKITYDKKITLFSYEKEYLQVLLIILNNDIDNFESKTTKEPKIVIHDDIASPYICDNRGGIELEIINPYYSTKFAKEGTGLGLYIAKMMIENSMHGQLRVRNQNSDAYFEITIPLRTTNV